jgi:tetratricopeptide (TPR) repeat protein
MSNNIDIDSIIADSKIAFIQGKYDEALVLASKAIREDSKNPDAYLCAGNAYMSMTNYEQAVEQYKKAVECDPENGDRYFHLGYAFSTNGQPAEGLAAFAKADELDCSPEVIGQLYKIMGMLCFEMKRYEDAVLNLCKAERIIGIDVDILQRKALSYGLSGKLAQGIEVANQIKLLAPTQYIGYRIAKELLLQENREEEVEKELDRARRFADPCMEYFFDRVSLELAKYSLDAEEEHLNEALKLLNDALLVLNPSVEEVVDCYVNAAEIYIRKEDSEMAINCLQASENPAQSYNERFSVVKVDYRQPEGAILRPSEREIERAIEDARRKYGDREIERMGMQNARRITENRPMNDEALTPVSVDMNENKKAYKLNPDEELNYTKEAIDKIDRLYVSAYSIDNDTAKIKQYASKLVASDDIQNQYIGKYSMAKALKDEGYEQADEEYETLLKFLRNASIKDPTDLMAVSFRVQCLIDMERYDEAEDIASLLSDELKKPLLEQINNAKQKY